MDRVHLVIASALMTGACLTLTAHAATTLAEWTFGEPGVAVVETDNSASANTGSNMVPLAGRPMTRWSDSRANPLCCDS